MDAVSTERLAELLSRLEGGSGIDAKFAAQTTALIAARMRRSKLVPEDVQRLSAAFLDDRRHSMKGVLGECGYSMPDVDFVFFPVVDSFAATLIDKDRTMVFLSLGLIEALRLAIASAQLESAIGRLERDQALAAALKEAGHRDAVAQLRALTQYFNACAVLHFKEPKQLPGAANLLDPATRHRVDVVLEAVMLFLLLHELGHVDYRRQGRSRSQLPHLAWEFPLPEDVNEAKTEEFYADLFALNAVPDAFALPLAHAATFFLHLYNYVDATLAVRPSTHPLCVNRIATLFAAAARKASPTDVGAAALSQAVEVGTRMWTQASSGFSLGVLRSYAVRLGETDWRPAQEALQLLAQHDDRGR